MITAQSVDAELRAKFGNKIKQVTQKGPHIRVEVEPGCFDEVSAYVFDKITPVNSVNPVISVHEPPQ
jgi:hypothetical protein